MQVSTVTLEHTSPVRRANTLLRADALAEGVCAEGVCAEGVCAVGVAALAVIDTGAGGTWGLPSWLSDPLLWIVAAVFAVTAVALAVLAVLVTNGRFTKLGLLAVLGAVNAVLAAAIAVWALVASGFGGGSATAFVVVGVGILILGIAQMNSFRKQLFQQ